MPRLTLAPQVLNRLPCLAWLAIVRRGGGAVTLLHGEGVQVDGRRFFEGAWSGELSTSFLDAVTFTGTGGEIRDGILHLATPTNTLHGLYHVRRGGTLFVSNSVPFLLQAAGSALRPDYFYYHQDLMSVTDGIHAHVGSIPTVREPVGIAYHCNVAVSVDLALARASKPTPGPLRDYDQYAALLHREVALTLANAADGTRRFRHRPLATVSTGYDSPACAVLARQAGCMHAITFAEANDGSSSDSGKAIGEILGLTVSEHDANAYLTRDDGCEIEFCATGLGGDDLPFASIEDALAGAIVVTGFHGDKVWDRLNRKVTRDIVRGDPSGGSMAEFRLRVGLQNLAVPFIAATEHPSIHAISNASAMRPWSTGGDYDRPIPRRLVEQAGVSRELFGHAKKAVAQPYHTMGLVDPPLEQRMSAATLRRFRAWLATASRGNDTLGGLRHRVLHAGFRLLRRAPYAWRWQYVLARYAKPRHEHDLLCVWACGQLCERYRAALAEVSPGRLSGSGR